MIAQYYYIHTIYYRYRIANLSGQTINKTVCTLVSLISLYCKTCSKKSIIY